MTNIYSDFLLLIFNKIHFIKYFIKNTTIERRIYVNKNWTRTSVSLTYFYIERLKVIFLQKNYLNLYFTIICNIRFNLSQGSDNHSNMTS